MPSVILNYSILSEFSIPRLEGLMETQEGLSCRILVKARHPSWFYWPNQERIPQFWHSHLRLFLYSSCLYLFFRLQQDTSHASSALANVSPMCHSSLLSKDLGLCLLLLTCICIYMFHASSRTRTRDAKLLPREEICLTKIHPTEMFSLLSEAKGTSRACTEEFKYYLSSGKR